MTYTVNLIKVSQCLTIQTVVCNIRIVYVTVTDFGNVRAQKPWTLATLILQVAVIPVMLMGIRWPVGPVFHYRKGTGALIVSAIVTEDGNVQQKPYTLATPPIILEVSVEIAIS